MFLGWRRKSRILDLKFCGSWNRDLEPAYTLRVSEKPRRRTPGRIGGCSWFCIFWANLDFLGRLESQSGPQHKLKQEAAPGYCWAVVQFRMTEGWAIQHSPVPKIPRSKCWEDGSYEDAHCGSPLLKHEKNPPRGHSAPLMTPLQYSSDIRGLWAGPGLAVLLRVQLLPRHFLW